MKIKMLIILALIGTLVLAAGAPRVASADTPVVPFKASYAGVPVGIPNFPWIDQTFEFYGQATHLGESHFSAIGKTYMLPPMNQFGDMTFTADNGDLLFGYYEGGGVVVSPGSVKFNGDFWITGGTGRFKNVTGSGIYWGTASPNALGEIHFNGKLNK